MRKQLKLTVPKFAQHLAVSTTLVYKWEKTPGELKMQSQNHEKTGQTTPAVNAVEIDMSVSLSGADSITTACELLPLLTNRFLPVFNIPHYRYQKPYFWQAVTQDPAHSMRDENFMIQIYIKSPPHGLRFLSMSNRLF